MSDFVETHRPCPSPDCGSSDALAINSDGWGTCFSCTERFSPEQLGAGEAPEPSTRAAGLPPFSHYTALRKRGLSEETCKRFQYGIYNTYQGERQGYRIGNAVKLRHPDKNFSWCGQKPTGVMFGQKQAQNKGRQIVITEGEIDAMVVFEALGATWPVISPTDGAGSMRKQVAENIEWLSGFERIVLCGDNDEPGREAIEETVEILPPGKAFIVELGDYKDADDFRREEGNQSLRQAIWNAKAWRPDGVANFADLREELAMPLEEGIPFPWDGLNRVTYGVRPGEIVTLTAGTGIGKTTVMAEWAYDLIMDKGKRVGLIFLEEGARRAGRRLLGIHTNKPCHLPGNDLSDAEFDEAFNAIFGSRRVTTYKHFGSIDPEILMSRMRYMRSAEGVDGVLLDHISIVASGADEDVDERRLLDRTMTRFRSFTEETGIFMGIVSHLRKPGQGKGHEEGRQVTLSDLRSSHGIAQLSDTILAFERDQQAEDNEERNNVLMRVLKCRATGMTGPTGHLSYEHKTGRLLPVDVAAFGDDDDGADF